MSEVDALFRLLTAAPPRSAQIVKRYALKGESLESIGAAFSVGHPEAKRLVLRALLDVPSGGTARLNDADEPALVGRVFHEVHGPHELSQLVKRLRTNAAELEQRLQRAAEEFERSPDRGRDEWLRRLAIAVVIGLTAFFYLREQNKPRPPPEKRPVFVPRP
jgi:hypothetical protein